MKFSPLTLVVPLLTTLAYADIKLPDPKNPKSGNFGIYQVTEESPGCVDAHCHGEVDGLKVQAASTTDRCSTGKNYYAIDDDGGGAYAVGGHLHFNQGVCGSKPLNCQPNGNQYTCKYNDSGSLAARCVPRDTSKGEDTAPCHGSGFGGYDTWDLRLVCNSDGSFHC